MGMVTIVCQTEHNQRQAGVVPRVLSKLKTPRFYQNEPARMIGDNSFLGQGENRVNIYPAVIREAKTGAAVYQIQTPPSMAPENWAEVRQAILSAARHPPATLTRLEFRLPSGSVIGVECDKTTDFDAFLALIPVRK